MSFAVFGASMDYCLKTARKRVKTTKGSGKSLVRLSAEEYELAVTSYAEKLFAELSQGKKTAVKISADFTTPNAANDFIELAKKTTTCAALRIYQRQPVKGKFHPKTKKQVFKFQPWIGIAQ